VLIAASPLLRNTIYPLIMVTKSVPKGTIAPVLIMFVGVGEMPKIFIGFLGSHSRR
jgi:ABC-type nitrate/sulfonate/bicarbonate transport system permease component